MESSSSSPKPRNKAKTLVSTNDEDKISELPDAILAQILSVFPTKFAVSTSALSKRWKFVWISVPNLDFGDKWSRHSQDRCLVKKALFRNFVDRVLHFNQVVSVRKVDLELYSVRDVIGVNGWINALVFRDAEEFHLTLPDSCLVKSFDVGSRIFSMPDSFFSKTKLVKLKLGNVVLKILTSVCFPCLKTICFKSVQLVDDDCMKNLLSGCPVIGKLEIERDVWDNVETLYVCSPTLDSLSLTTWYCYKDVGYKVVIDAPNLCSMYVSGEVGVTFDVINVSSLKKAELSIRQDRRVSKDAFDFDQRLFKFMHKISHVKELELATETMRCIENITLMNVAFFEVLLFDNLTNLTVDFCRDVSWQVLPHLLNCLPNLVTCLLRLNHAYPGVWYDLDELPRCLSCLETIFIFDLKNVTNN